MITQAQRLGEALKKLKVDITAEDRKALTTELNYQSATVVAYLNGVVKDNDTAVKIIEFFRARIAAREKVIN